MTGIEQIEQTVLKLPLQQRVWLTESLLDSLPPAGDELSEAAELEEVERCDREIESGQVRPPNEEEFFQRVEARRKQ